MKRRDFCRLSLIAGAAVAVPASRLIAASEASSQLRPTDLHALKLSGVETTIRGPPFATFARVSADRCWPLATKTMSRRVGSGTE